MYLPKESNITANICFPETNFNTIVQVFNSSNVSVGYLNAGYPCSAGGLSLSLAAGYYTFVVDGVNGVVGKFKLNVSGAYVNKTDDFELVTKDSVHNKTTDVTLYPNPATDKITVSLLNLNENENVLFQLYNAAGTFISEKIVLTSSVNTNVIFDIESLPNAVYYVKIQGKNFSEVRRFVKNL